MSNKLTFSEPGTAKVSWQVQYGEEQLDNSMLDSVVLNINGIPQSIDLTKNSTEIQVSKTTSVNMEVTYGGVTTKTKNLMVEILENDGPDEPDEPIQPTSKSVYYGSLTIGDGKLWDKGGESETLAYLTSLDMNKINTMIDKSPLTVSGSKIAHANSLVNSNNTITNPTNCKLGFYGESATAEYAQPILIYPVSLGEVKKITDVSGNPLNINSSDKSGFYRSTILLDGVEHYVYVHKVPDSTPESGSPVYINFSK